MRYRLLTDVELKALEDEFAKFLVASDISSEEWVKLNNTNPIKAVEIVEHFSDSIFEDVLNRVTYLEKIESKEIKIFKANEESIQLIAMKTNQNNLIDFTKIENFGDFLEKNIENIDIYKGKKKYSPNRNQELFNITEAGASITDEKFWLLMSKIVK